MTTTKPKKNVNNSKEISQELKDDLKSLDEVNTYIFLKQNKGDTYL